MMSKLNKMLEMAEATLERDIERIWIFGKNKKLTPGYGRDLREYVKVLTLLVKVQKDAKAEEKNDLSKLSNEELFARAKELIGADEKAENGKREIIGE